MKFAICNEIFQDAAGKFWPLEKQFATAAAIGFDGIEIAPFTIANDVNTIGPEVRAGIRALAARYGVAVAGIHWLLAQTSGYHITAADPEVRARTLRYLQALVRFGVEIGGTMAVVGSPFQRAIPEGVTYDQGWEWFKAAMAGAAAQPGAESFHVSIEPLAPSQKNSFIVRAEEARKMVREINLPNVGVILDTFSSSEVEDDLPQAIRETGSLLRHYHCNDDNRRAPGFGKIDFVPIMRALLDIRFERFASIEAFDFSLDPLEQCRRGLGTLREALAKAGG